MTYVDFLNTLMRLDIAEEQSIWYGFRNVEDMQYALLEMYAKQTKA